jgi:ABC-type Mn2+/Zn2+ transport system permease subunit
MITTLYDLATLFPNALVSGIVMAVACSVLGVFVVLKRVVFISITLSETATCGIAASMLFQLPPITGAVALTTVVAAFLSFQYETSRISRDAVLGVIFLTASASSILLVAHSGFGLHEVKAILYGDLILSSPLDRNLMLIISLPALLFFLLFLRPIFFTFLDREASQVMGIAIRIWEPSFFFVLALVVSAASKSGGVLLVFCYLVVPPATALLVSRNLPAILLLSAAASVFATLSGLTLSYKQDLPGNQTIILVSCILFAGTWASCKLVTHLKNKTEMLNIRR